MKFALTLGSNHSKLAASKPEHWKYNGKTARYGEDAMFMRFLLGLALAGSLAVDAQAQSQSSPNSAGGHVVKYHATVETVKYLYGPGTPVLRLKSGDILETNTLDCFGDAIQKPGDTLSMARGDNPISGAYCVEGAEPGDTLAIRL